MRNSFQALFETVKSIIAPNLVSWVLKRIFSVKIVENDICLGGVSKQMPFFQKIVPLESRRV